MNPRRAVIIEYRNLLDTIADEAAGKAPSEAVFQAYADYRAACERHGEPAYRFSVIKEGRVCIGYPYKPAIGYEMLTESLN